MTKNSSHRLFKFLLISASLAPGVIIYLGYKFGWHFSGVRLGLTSHSKDLSLLLASFSFSMLGVLATIITILIALSDKLHLKSYKANHHLDEFLLYYFFNIGNLTLTFISAIVSLGKNAHPLVFDAMLVCFINSLFGATFIAYIVCNILRHALKENA